MAIEYTVIQRPNPNNRRQVKHYASTRMKGETTVDDLCEEAKQISTVSGADLRASLHVLGEMLSQHLADGRRIRVDGLGSFHIALSSEGKEKAEEVNSHTMKDARIIFRPSAKLSRMLKLLTYKKVSKR